MGDQEQVELIPLYRCKQCRARMFERDCHGHLGRHGILANGDWRQYYVRGKRDTPLRVGGHHKPLYQYRHYPKAGTSKTKNK